MNQLNFGDRLDTDYVSQQFAKAANRAKQDMTPDEFINLCKLVLENQKSKG